MASNPPQTCCTTGVKHEGVTTGSITQISGIDAYVAEPRGSKVNNGLAIIYLPDVIGIWQNSKLIADQFAANGYYTLLLDILNGDPVPLNRPSTYDLYAWREHGNDGKTPHTEDMIIPLVEKAIRYLRIEKGFTRIGGVGYCFGAKFMVLAMGEPEGIDVGYIAHPSFVEKQELAAIRGPLSIGAAEIDQVFTKELRSESENTLAETGYPWQINLYSGVRHGFAVRCDLSDKQQRLAKEQTFLQAIAWFNTYLK